MIAEDFLDLVFTGKSEIADPIAARMAVATGVAGAESIRNNSKLVTIDKPQL